MNDDDDIQYSEEDLQAAVLAERQQCAAHYLKIMRDAVTEARAKERNRCVSIIENYQIHVGASTAGEIACEMTYSALREIRDEIKGEKNE